ncbi:hypothetical protein UPYG_G00258270 [Umbra pygmaea]|uniref:Ankyrin repeat domain-containing protein 26 n=1 Tax=Umbra pygmaea TaxID=75934 RepID=A0ABD0W8R1_UMBPY
MKKIFNFTKKKKGFSPNTSDTASVLSLGYDLKEKDLVKVHKAAYGGDLAKLKQLAKKNDINQLDKDNRTALHVACVNGHTDVVQFLVESKAKLNLCDNQNRSPLMKAVQCQQERCVATLLEHDADPNLVDVNGNTALHLASCIPSITTAMLLLENDATINAQNKEGYSPLTMAVKENHADMTEFLLKEGADINIKDLGNRTPLMIAACNGQISLVRLLLQYDADITSKDNNGWSSDDYAVMNGHHACSHLIIEHGAKRKSMRSPAHAPTRKSQASMLASSSQEAGFSLGGPATDKEEQGAIRAGQDVEDNSQTESMSRASKSVADDSWPSSDEDDELHIALKKHPKPNLKKLMNISKKQNDAVPVTDLDESEHESEDRVQRNQPCPQAFLPRCAPQHVVSPISAASFTFKPPQMTSSPFQSSIKEKYSTEDDEEYEEKDEGGDENEQEKSYIEELVDGNMKHQTEENNNPLVDALIPGSENASTEKQRDFLSELGLEKEDEEDSWDTESGSGSPRKQNARAPPKGPVCIISEKNEVLRHDDADRDDVLETEVKGMSGKQLTSSILSKLEMSIEDTEKKTDALDWDRLSTTSKRNLPGCRPPPSIDSELKGEATFPPISAVILADVQAPESSDPDIIALADSSRPEEISSPHSPLPLASQHFLVSQTWPHAQKMLPQCGECEEDSDWDSDHVTTSTSSPVRLKKQLPNITKSTAMLKPHNLLCGPSPFKQEGETSPEPKKQPQEVGESQIKMEVLQKSRASWDAEGTRSNQSEHKLDVEEEEKPYTTSENPKESCRSEATETQSRLRAGDSINQRQWSKNLKSADRALEDQQQQQQQQQERRAVTNKATLKLPSLGGAKHGQAPQAVNHVNGQDPLSVFDDSTLSDVSDDDRRHPSKELQKDKPQNSGGVEMMEDFDDLTQSSDTATSDLEDPTSIYRQASFLMKQHDFSSLDSVSMVKLQNMFQEYERTIQREKSRQGRLVDKMRQLEAERAELRGSLEEVRDIKQALDHRQLELDTDLNNLKFQLKQEQEKHRNASMLYDKTRETLRKKEEELRLEVEGKHEVELAKRNQELKMRAILNKMKQLEEDRSETKKLLNQERSARALSETILNNHLRKQQDIVEENRKAICKSNEALSQLTEATDRERELLQQNSVLQADVSSLRAELEHFHSHSSQKESRLSEESEALRERLEDARRDLKLNEEALAQTVYQYTSQLTNLKAELVVKSSRLEHEHQTREQLEVEGESARTRLSSALQEAERCQAALAEAERALQREREEHQRSQDRLIGESANNRLAIDGLSQKLSKAESCANSFENEVHRITMTLTETEHVVTALQRDKELAGGRVRELEAALLAEREQAGRACARQEALQERLAGAQSEAMLLRQQLEEAHNKGTAKEKAVTDAQERFGDLLAKLRSDGEEHVQLVEERSKELAIKAADLRDQVYKLEEEKNERETSFRQLQQELADSLKMLSMSEASLEVNTRYRNDLEEEKARLLKERDRLKGKVEEREEEYVQAQRNINALKSNLAEKDRVVVAASQKLQEVSSALAGSDTIKKQLEEAVQRLEIENARLEAAAKQQTNKIEALQKQIQDAAIVRNRLEDLVTGLQGSKMTLEEQLGREVQKQGMLSHNAQDSHILWEEELKSRSMLGLRLAELEKEKAELSSQMDLEKKKAKKIAGQKKSVDSRLDEEIKRNTDLQKEMYRLRTLVKTAKKKLREQEGAVTEFGSPMRGEMGDRLTEAAISRMKDKVNDLTMQLEKETLRCSQLETLNCDLKEQLSSLKFLSRSNERLERSKRQLEEEVLGLRQKVEAGLMDQSQADQYRRDAEDRARQEINRKLEEVNTFLQTQAASQEVLEQMTAANEASLRLNLEQRIRELEVELNRVRSTQHESMNLRDSDHNELGRYRELYVEEMHRRKSLAAKLERCNERLVEANSKLLNERHRSKSLIASSIVNGTLGGPSLLEMGSLGSVGAYGTTLGPINRSMGGPLLNSLGDMGQSTSVEAYLAKQQNELERTISKAVDYATAELEGSTRVSPIGSASISPTSLGIAVTLEKDPVSRTAQQYLEVLKKNYKI